MCQALLMAVLITRNNSCSQQYPYKKIKQLGSLHNNRCIWGFNLVKKDGFDELASEDKTI